MDSLTLLRVNEIKHAYKWLTLILQEEYGIWFTSKQSSINVQEKWKLYVRWGWQQQREKNRFKFIVIRWTIIKLSDFWFCFNPNTHTQIIATATTKILSANISVAWKREKGLKWKHYSNYTVLVERWWWNKNRGNWWPTSRTKKGSNYFRTVSHIYKHSFHSFFSVASFNSVCVFSLDLMPD